MTDHAFKVEDPFLWPFWEAASERRLSVQRCRGCSQHQFYPRPFCLSCEGRELDWVDVTGAGEVYSITTVRIPVSDLLPPPYQVALVTLDAGPRLLAGIDGPACSIGDRVRLVWREREDAPPFPAFERVAP
ncbi:Zn-ribbon domain-containing OB-fold protein [Bosea sp. 2YAB26]|uniref:Zn-ribbon domain-containing OB-fold protein n=1 Tax=Bosea sp. 2YAB26 TaxID=3237478 RepID=UPI003F8E8ECD